MDPIMMTRPQNRKASNCFFFFLYFWPCRCVDGEFSVNPSTPGPNLGEYVDAMTKCLAREWRHPPKNSSVVIFFVSSFDDLFLLPLSRSSSIINKKKSYFLFFSTIIIILLFFCCLVVLCIIEQYAAALRMHTTK